MSVQLTNTLIREFLTSKGQTAPAGKLHLIGLRGSKINADGSLSLIPNTFDQYNDTITVFGLALQSFVATVDPGATWTLNPSNPKGCAHLQNGHWLYKIGTHKGKPALNQAAEVIVRRDKDKDGVDEPGEPLDKGYFGINVHAGGTRPTIGAWSAGCQVIKGGWTGTPWLSFWQQIVTHRQDVYHYFLYDFADFAKFINNG